jgi:hypothetical protein
MERPQAGTADRADGLARMDAGGKQGLGRVDVSKAGDAALVHQK